MALSNFLSDLLPPPLILFSIDFRFGINFNRILRTYVTIVFHISPVAFGYERKNDISWRKVSLPKSEIKLSNWLLIVKIAGLNLK
jgi:hypothetical protein